MTVKAGAWAAGVCVLAAAIGTGLYWKYGGGGNKGGWAMAPAKVVAPAVQADFPVSLSGIGSLEATRQVQVPAEVDGRVAQILFNPGESARAGQLLVQLNDAPEQGELARLQAQVKNARAQLDRSRRLLPLQAATREQLDQAQADYDQAQGDLRRVQAQIEQKRIKAPFDGVLGVRRVNLGQFARAGDPLVSLTNTSTMYANLTLPEQALGALRPGQSVRVTVDAHPGRAFTGKVTTIEPQVDPGTRTVRVQATLDNADGALAAGMYAQGQVNLPARPGVITVPETAVSYSAYGNSVYVVNPAQEGKGLTVRQAYVKTAERMQGRVVVSEGLQAGDRVVTSGQLRLHNGAAVELSEQDTVALDAAAPARPWLRPSSAEADMRFTDLFVRRPVLALVVSTLILLLGLRALSGLPVRQYPLTESTTITVTTEYPGASPDLMQGFVTQPIAQSVATVEGIDYLSSSSTQGRSVITVRMKLNADSNKAMTEVMAKVNEVKYRLPRDAYDPVLVKSSGEATAVAYVGFSSSTLSLAALTDYLSRGAAAVLFHRRRGQRAAVRRPEAGHARVAGPEPHGRARHLGRPAGRRCAPTTCRRARAGQGPVRGVQHPGQHRPGQRGRIPRHGGQARGRRHRAPGRRGHG